MFLGYIVLQLFHVYNCAPCNFVQEICIIIIIIIIIIDLITVLSIQLLQNLHLSQIISGIRLSQGKEIHSIP